MPPLVLRFVMALLGLCFGCILALSAAMAEAQGPGRKALIIANWTYGALPTLINPPADAAAYDEMLGGLGYVVSYHQNLDLDAMDAAINGFVASIQKGDEVVVVYTGHGWSDGRENFLEPVDSPGNGSETRLRGLSYPLRDGDTGLLDRIDAAGAAQVVAIIDACRNNPFAAKEGTKAIGYSRGLARISAPQGSFVIFSAGEGQEALDRLPDDPPGQRLSVFTRNLVPLLGQGLYLEDAVAAAQLATASIALSYDNHLQHPAYYDETLGKTCLGQSCLDPSAIVSEATVPSMQIGLEQAPVAFDTATPTMADSNPLVLACDIAVQHAGNPDNPNKVPGVYLKAIDVLVAERDCKAANAAFPDHNRTLYHLARIKSAQKDQEAAFVIHQTLAGRDYKIAIIQLASSYQEGRGTTVNLPLAKRFYQIACDKEFPMGCAALGEIIYKGDGTAEDKGAGLALMNAACDDGSGYGCNLAGIYLDKDNATKDQARALFARSCELDWMEGCANYGLRLRRIAKTATDYMAALPPYEKACTAKVNWACRNIGYMYRDGKGPDKDLDVAARYFTVGCDLDDGDACNARGFLLRNTGDFAQAYDFIEKSCGLNHMPACVTQGYMLEKGEGVAADVAAGMALYELACSKDNATGCTNAGLMFNRVSYLEHDPAKALAAFEKGCGLKDPVSCLEASYSYLDKDRTPADEARAQALAQTACDLEHAKGCRQLGYQLNEPDASAAQLASAVAAFDRGCALGDASSCVEKGMALVYGHLGLTKDEAAGLVQMQQACGMKDAGYACEMLLNRYRQLNEPAKAAEAALRACNAGRADPCAELAFSAQEVPLPRPALDLLVLERKSQAPNWYLEDLQAPQITLLQQALIKLGFYAGTADGKLGPATRAALSRVYE